MVGIGETYLPAFALSVGLGEIAAGVLSTLPLVSGAFLQLLTPKGLQRVGSHKSWVVLTVAFQALAFVPLIFFAIGQATKPDFWLLFLVLSLYWGAGFSAGPSWNYWMGNLVPSEISEAYFARRARFVQTGILIGLVIGGVALHNRVTILSFSSVFAGLFTVALICRLASSWILSRQMYRQEWNVPGQLLGLRDSWKIFWANPIKRNFFLLLFPFLSAVHISGPFVTPYFLAQLRLDYGAYMIAIATLMTGKILALRWIESRQQRWGGLRIFWVGLLAVSPGPMLWFLSTNYTWVLALQFVSGVAWAFFEVGLALIFFKDLGSQEKVPILTVYNLINATAVIVGTGIGALLLSIWGEELASYLWIFFVGGLFRVILSRPLLQQTRRWQELISAK